MPIGVTTAAVPQAKASRRRPLSASAATGRCVALLAHRRCPCPWRSVSSESRVMPGRIVPPSGGVTMRAVVEHEEHVHAAQLLDPAALDGVEEHDLVAAVRASPRPAASRLAA